MRDYSLHRQQYPQRPKKKTLALGIFFLLTILAVYLFQFKKSDSANLKAIESQNKTSETTNPLPKQNPSSPEELLKKIKLLTSAPDGSYSIYIYDLNKKQGFGINGETVLAAASLNKIPILASLYYLAGKGEIDLERTITLQVGDIQDYGTGVLRYTTPGGLYSFKTLARLMMEKSDNTAAYLLASQIIGLKKIQQLIDSWGLVQTTMDDNKTSAFDMALLLIKIYQGEITSPALTKEMLDFMDKSDFEDRIPAGLPPGIRVYHKTGDEIGKIHDVAVIDLDSKPYYLGVLTSDVTNDEEAKKNIAAISKLVFEFMKN